MQHPTLLAPLVLSALAMPALAATVHSVDTTSGLETWETDDNRVALRLTQISPDQAQGFFEARGFPQESARHYANACVFMTVVRNTGNSQIEFDLRRWRYVAADGIPQPLKLKEDWLKEWDARGVSKPARIGFEWSQLPTAQTYAPGDWNQGMTTYALPRGARFDVHYQWQSGGKTHDAKLEGARCTQPESGK